jgi:hypothetical protein
LSGDEAHFTRRRYPNRCRGYQAQGDGGQERWCSRAVVHEARGPAAPPAIDATISAPKIDPKWDPSKISAAKDQ